MKDFHIHYYLDGCARPEMTFPNIMQACRQVGIDECAVLKHYSANMPNGLPDWVFWHQVKYDMFERYLKEFSQFDPGDIKLHSGVETELCNEQGDINIPLCDQQKVDIVQLSVHYMLNLDCIKLDLMIYPNLKLTPHLDNPENRKLIENWREKVNSVGAERICVGLVNAYCNAVKRFPKVRSLAHMDDGFKPLRAYCVDVDSIPLSRRIEILEPLMKTAAEHGVYWELIDGISEPAIIKRGQEMGMTFTWTRDAHWLSELTRDR